MKIYTKTGDDGTSSIIGGRRLAKNHAQLEAYGTIDELNSTLGMLLNYLKEENDVKIILLIQNKLIDICSILAIDELKAEEQIKQIQQITENDIKYIEEQIDNYSNNLPKLTNFILPNGSIEISWFNISRCICRRAERKMVSINNIYNKNSIIYINRLSDLLFTMGRNFAKKNNIKEILYKKDI